MKRFYKTVTLQKDTGQNGDVFDVLLDGKVIRSPLKNPLRLHNEALASAIREEWDAQEDTVEPAAMPLTQIIFTLEDKVRDVRPELTETLLNYADSDLLYFRVKDPPALEKRQAELWDKGLDWFDAQTGYRPPLCMGYDYEPLPQDIRAKLRTWLDSLDDLTFTLFAMIVPQTGSFILSYGFLTQDMTLNQVMAAAFCEEDFYVELYKTAHNGPDPAIDAKKSALRKDLDACLTVMSFLKK